MEGGEEGRPRLAPLKEGPPFHPCAWVSNQAAWGRRPCHLRHCHSASPSALAVFMDQVLGRTLRIQPPVLRGQVLAGHRQKTRMFHERTLCWAFMSCELLGLWGEDGGRWEGWEGCLPGPGGPS